MANHSLFYLYECIFCLSLMLLSIKFRFLNPSFFFLDEVDVCPWKISFKCHKFEGDYCKDYAERRHQRDEWAWWVDHGWNDKKWHHTDFYGLWGGFQVLLIPSKFWIIPDRDHYISTFFLDHVANLITVDYWVLQHTISSNPPFSLSFIHQKDVARPHKQLFHDISWLVGVDSLVLI